MSSGIAISIGNFDGAHKGHLALVHAAREAVGGRGRVVMLSFDPHPMVVLRPERRWSRLSSLEQRRQWLGEAGADEVVPLEPTPELLAQSPEEFLRFVAEAYRPSLIVEGPDFRFGRDRSGSVGTLADLGAAHGFATLIIDPVEDSLSNQSVVRVSSSLIRWLVQRGRVRDGARLLGRPYELRGEVVRGERRGRGIGVPTINLDPGDFLLPADGVYAGTGRGSDGAWYPAAISVGTKPTFGAHPRICEAHLVGFDGEEEQYGWGARLRFIDWLREQIAYASVEALVDQLRRDIDATRGAAVPAATR